jgi:site-specific recombinase XerD
LPAILSWEVASFLDGVPSLKYRTVFATIFAAGLHISEAVALTIKDIESERMVIHIRQGNCIQQSDMPIRIPSVAIPMNTASSVSIGPYRASARRTSGG